jgi:hypothetical protein
MDDERLTDALERITHLEREAGERNTEILRLRETVGRLTQLQQSEELAAHVRNWMGYQQYLPWGPDLPEDELSEWFIDAVRAENRLRNLIGLPLKPDVPIEQVPEKPNG